MVQIRVEGFNKKAKPNDETERVIEKDDSTSSVTTEYEDGKPYARTWHQQLAHLFGTIKFQIFIVSLVLFNGLIVISGLFVQANIIDLFGQAKTSVPHIFHCISVGLLVLFISELSLKIFSLKLDFFKSKMEVFDGVVIVATFSLDVAMSRYEGPQPSVGLLVLLRLWRIGKILNCIILSIKADANHHLRHEKRRKEAMERELSKYKHYCALQDKEITVLQELLKKHGISFTSVEKPFVGETISVVVEVNSAAMEVGSVEQTNVT